MKILIVKDNYSFLEESGNWSDHLDNEEVWVREEDFDAREIQKEWNVAKRTGIKLYEFLEKKGFEIKLFEEIIK